MFNVHEQELFSIYIKFNMIIHCESCDKIDLRKSYYILQITALQCHRFITLNMAFGSTVLRISTSVLPFSQGLKIEQLRMGGERVGCVGLILKKIEIQVIYSYVVTTFAYLFMSAFVNLVSLKF